MLEKIKLLNRISRGIKGKNGSPLKIYPNHSTGNFSNEGLNRNINVRLFMVSDAELNHNEMHFPATVGFSLEPKGIYFGIIENELKYSLKSW